MRALYSMTGRVPLARVIKENRAALIPLGVVLAANVVVLVAVVLPLSQRVSTNEQRAIAAERQRMVAQAEFKRAEALRDGQAQATEDLTTFYKEVLPTDVTAARRILQLRLQQRARESSVQYQSGGTTEEELSKSSLLRLTTQMRLSGDYNDIRGFIYTVETSPDFVIIDNVKLAEGIDANAPLSVFLAVSTYYRAPQSAVARTGNNGR
jgi:type IV pilus assembly protein PilO